GGGVAWIAVVGVACDDIPEASRQYVGYHDYFTGRLDYAADDHGNTPATATPMNPTDAAHGVVERNGDKDVFALTLSQAGSLSLDAKPALYGPMLDIKMTVQDASGAVIGTYDPALGLVEDDRYGAQRYRSLTGNGAAAQLKLAAGTYYVTIEGVGYGDLSKVTATDTTMAAAAYGSLGQYSLASTFVADAIQPPANANADAGAAANSGTAANANGSAASSGSGASNGSGTNSASGASTSNGSSAAAANGTAGDSATGSSGGATIPVAEPTPTVPEVASQGEVNQAEVDHLANTGNTLPYGLLVGGAVLIALGLLIVAGWNRRREWRS
ncbi:hypothetical protein, partial [Psychromicrobium xiongbiense]|uniref:hypothetical protein n=1 Tax=Psychromicrobium xiongbiense TaxID=3051184 RepID=UPI003B21A127